MICGYSKLKTDGGSAKMSTRTLDVLQNWLSNAEYSMRAADIASMGTRTSGG